VDENLSNVRRRWSPVLKFRDIVHLAYDCRVKILIQEIFVIAETIILRFFDQPMLNRIPKYISEAIVIILLAANTSIPVIPPDLASL
jgi:hypothetical protein